MLRRVATLALLAAAFAAPAHAQGTELVPGVTYERTVEFTPWGSVVLHVVTAPRPGSGNGIWQLAPALAGGTLTGGAAPLTRIEQSLAPTATTVGIGADLAASKRPGVYLAGGVLMRPPRAARSSIGVDAAGGLHVDRVRLFGTWRGTGQRRTLDTVNRVPTAGEVALFTPAYGPAVPSVPGSADAILSSFPAALPNADLHATVAATGSGGGEPIPSGGAILMAAGPATAAKLAAEAPVGASVTVRLGLQPAWTGVVSALGGGPLLVRDGRPVFRSGEDFANDEVSARVARAGVGQLADGRVVLVVADGGRPGYSVGLSSYELARAMAGLGVVTGCAVASGAAVSLALDGGLLDRPATVEQPLADALILSYEGIYAPQPPLALLDGEPGQSQTLSYRIVRPSTVTAQLVAPDGTVRTLESSAAHAPGTYTFAYSAFDAEGTWHWHVSAVDDEGRSSTDDRSFRYDRTVQGAAVAQPARGRATVTFTLTRPASVALSIATRSGVVVRALPPVSLAAGPGSVSWDGRLPHGSRAYGGAYVARLVVSSAVGTSELDLPFVFRRVG